MCEFMYGIERNGLNEKPKSTDKAYCEAIQDKEEKLVTTMKWISIDFSMQIVCLSNVTGLQYCGANVANAMKAATF